MSSASAPPPTTPNPTTTPKSNTQHPPSNTPSLPTTPLPQYENPPHGNISLAPDAPHFFHPSHVIPARNYPNLTTLILVCCHAIFHPDISNPSFPLHSPYNEHNWHLAPFQTSSPTTGKPGEHETFLSHISAALETLTTGSCAGDSLLIFSGAATKKPLSNLSEARSYYHAALAQSLARGQLGGGHVRGLYEKGWILLEERATDSFQNLLFSILLFRQQTGRYPRQIRVVTHAFKARRVLELHAPAIRWPGERIRVLGIDPVMSARELEGTVRGELERGYGAWEGDLLGVGEVLRGKRVERGWDGDVGGMGEGLEESVKKLLDGEVVDELPWSKDAALDGSEPVADE